MLPSCHQNPTAVNDASPVASLGHLYEYEGRIYKYVKFEDAVTYAAGHCCVYGDTTGYAVTNDKDQGVATSAGAGVCVRVMTQNYYGYLLVHGLWADCLGDGSVAAGDSIFSSATDGAFDTVADATVAQPMGIALEADDSSNLFDAMITCL